MTETQAGVYGRFAEVATDRPTAPFIWFEGETTSYGEALDAVNRRAALLDDCGVERGDRVGLLVPNDPEAVLLLLATLQVGATCVPFDFRQEGDVLVYLLEDADPSVLVVDDSVTDRFEDIAADVGVSHVFTHDAEESVARDLDATVADVDGPKTSRPTTDPFDVAVVNYTSGTTGAPKGVENPHRAFLDVGDRLAAACGTDARDRALLVLPVFHANPLSYGLMQMLAVGGSVALVRQFSASRFWQTARDAEATYFTHVGSVLEILRRADDDSTNPNTDLRFALGGAAAFSSDAQRAFEARFDLQLVRLYGLSEVGAGMITTATYDPTRPGGQTHQGSVATQPFDVRIRVGEELRSQSADPGEILVRPDRLGLLFRGYRGKAERTVADWQDLWMRTGDLGRIDDDGHLHFLGRVDASIRRMGENVSPWEVETPLDDWGRVDAVAVVGVPDDVAGEELKLSVVTADPSLTPVEVFDYCRKTLPPQHVPRYVELVEELPYTSTQKVERASLRDRGVDGAWDAERGGTGR